jgi:hypothetical protein
MPVDERDLADREERMLLEVARLAEIERAARRVLELVNTVGEERADAVAALRRALKVRVEAHSGAGGEPPG